MKFIEQINNIAKKGATIKVFIDMDGTVTEFLFDDTESYMQEGGYLKKKPIIPVIEQINNINNNLYSNIELFILSCSETPKMSKEKDEWIDKYLPYIKKQNRIYLTKENDKYNYENANIVKGEYIKSILKEDEIAIIIDDNHSILKHTKEILKERIYAFHVTSLLI